MLFDPFPFSELRSSRSPFIFYPRRIPMKKFVALALLCSFALISVGCGGDKTTTTSSKTTKTTVTTETKTK